MKPEYYYGKYIKYKDSIYFVKGNYSPSYIRVKYIGGKKRNNCLVGLYIPNLKDVEIISEREVIIELL